MTKLKPRMSLRTAAVRYTKLVHDSIYLCTPLSTFPVQQLSRNASCTTRYIVRKQKNFARVDAALEFTYYSYYCLVKLYWLRRANKALTQKQHKPSINYTCLI